jgi:hypothetical protein
MRLHNKHHKYTNETGTMEIKEHYCRVLQLHIWEVPCTDHHIIPTDDLRGLSYSLQTLRLSPIWTWRFLPHPCPFITYCAEIRRCIIRGTDSVVK